MKIRYVGLFSLCMTGILHLSYAAQITTPVYSTDAAHTLLGNIVFKDSPYGLIILPALKGLPPGMHGFHIHQHPDCQDMGMAAGGHFDPTKTNTHRGPYNQGHLGDMPALYVNNDGNANAPTLAPRLKTKDMHHLSVMVHEGGDTYSDTPPLGGGGPRIACGKIE